MIGILADIVTSLDISFALLLYIGVQQKKDNFVSIVFGLIILLLALNVFLIWNLAR